MSKLLIIVAVLCLHEVSAASSFLSKTPEAEEKKRVNILDSRFVQQRIEALSGKKVDVEKLKKSFGEGGPTATLKTVLGSQPMFNYIVAKRGTPLDKDTQVDGLDLLQTRKEAEGEAEQGSGTCDDANSLTPCDELLASSNPVVDTTPSVEAELAQKGLKNVYNDLSTNGDEIKANLETALTKEMAGPVRAVNILYDLLKTGRVIRAVSDPVNAEVWSPVKSDDEEYSALDDLEKLPESDISPPAEMGELSDIPDWLEHKM